MTRTQLQEMSDRELVQYARERNYLTGNKLVEELANRLDDVYPFNPEPETTGDLQEA